MMNRFNNVVELTGFLEDYGVPVHEFGTGKAKTLEQLLEEVNSGETRLLHDDTVLIRYFLSSIVEVYHEEYKLHEDRQEFTDGRVRRRGFDFLAEKMSAEDDSPDDAALRCMKEEMDIHDIVPVYNRHNPMLNADSMSYPGILTIADLFYYTVELPDKYYNADGYVEEQSSKTNYYQWHVDRTRL